MSKSLFRALILAVCLRSLAASDGKTDAVNMDDVCNQNATDCKVGLLQRRAASQKSVVGEVLRDMSEPATKKTALLPTFFMHGFEAYANSGNMIIATLKEHYPDTTVISAPIYEGELSHEYMFNQARGLIAYIKNHTLYESKLSKGINLICHSQGGLVCRGAIQLWTGHPVKTFVTLASPQMGVTSFKDVFTSMSKKNYERFMTVGPYSPLMQRGPITDGCKGLSAANYWKDMRQYRKYQQVSEYLAIINNEAPAARCEWSKEHARCEPENGAVFEGLSCGMSAMNFCVWEGKTTAFYNRNPQMQANFESLEKYVATGSPQDGMIFPWQSSTWGYQISGCNYKHCPNSTIEYKDTPLGKHNLLPLQKMMDANKAFIIKVDNVGHGAWCRNSETVKHYLEYLS